MKKIAYIGGCHLNNIGNAFIDYGSMYTLNDYDFCFFSELRWKYKNNYNILLNSNFAAVVFSGMVMCPSFIEDNGYLITEFTKKNIPIVLNGCGGHDYSKYEVETFSNFICENNFKLFISRDDVAFEKYHKLFPKSEKGLDVAFFLPEYFKTIPNINEKYIVVNDEDNKFSDAINYRTKNYSNKIINSKHKMTLQYGDIKNLFVSELASEFVYLYANAESVFSTRIHGCICSLAFDTEVMLFSDSPRANIFKTVGANDIQNRLVKADKEKLNARKSVHIKSLKGCLDELCK